jgi:long-chain acyl-CoA synthetase
MSPQAWNASPSPLAAAEFIDVATTALRERRSMAELFLASARRHAARPAFTNLGRTLSYGDLDRLSGRLAAYFRHALGLERGTRVAIMLPNVLQFPVALCAIHRADLVAVPVNPLYTPRELEHQLADSGAAALIVLENFGAVAAQALPGTAVRHVLTTRVGDLLGFPKGAVVDFTLKYVRKAVPAFAIPNAVRWPAALARGARHPAPEPTVGHEDPAQLQYTGGTTGVSKGAVLDHRALLANVASAEQWLGRCLDPATDVDLICLPLYHIAALSNLLYAWAHGFHCVLVTNPRDIPGLVAALRHCRPAIFSGVNTLYDALLNAPGIDQVDFSGLKLSLQGGTALRRATAERWQALTGCRVCEMYGLSETTGGVTVNRWDADNPVGSIGLPMPGVEIALRDERGVDVAPGDAGELCIRGPQVTTGYWQRPEESAQAFFADGWFRSGDVARRDADGYLYLLDRRKDMILVSGFNVFPNEIEDVAALHPGVLEAAAVGVPDEKSGEAVKLVIVRRDPALTDEAIRAHCRTHLTGYKQPRIVEFRDTLPKTAVGKILRRELR